MKRSVTLMMMTAFLASVPAWAAPPFGSFGGKVGGGNSGAGLLPLQGWALDDGGVDSVDILVDGFVAGRADYHRNRPGVARLYPGYPDSVAPGWAYSLDTTHYLNGNHRITPRIKSRTGEYVSLPSQIFAFGNLTHNLVPFGKIEFPNSQAELRGNCTSDPARRYSVVSGYALDAGVQEDDTGVGYTELITTALLLEQPGGLLLQRLAGRLDELLRLPPRPRAALPPAQGRAHSGYRYIIDVGALIALGSKRGAAPASIRAATTSADLDHRRDPGDFSCDEGWSTSSRSANQPPRLGQMIIGFAIVSGFAIDGRGSPSSRC